jgi:hypothetical protein
MAHLTNDDRILFEATAERYRVFKTQEQKEFKSDMIEIALIVVGAILLCLLAYAILLPSLNWCQANYSVELVPECLYRENLIFGHLIN